MRGMVPGVVLGMGLVTQAACAPMTASSHLQRGLDFSPYRTYDWGPADTLPTGDPRLDKNPFFQDHVQGAVERQMAARGFERAAVDSQPDLLIHYHAVIHRRFDVNRIDRDYGLCADDDCRVRVVEYELGTLVVDVVDTRTSRVIWRGWAQAAMNGVLDDEDRLAKRIDEAALRILARFPRPFVERQEP